MKLFWIIFSILTVALISATFIEHYYPTLTNDKRFVGGFLLLIPTIWIITSIRDLRDGNTADRTTKAANPIIFYAKIAFAFFFAFVALAIIVGGMFSR